MARAKWGAATLLMSLILSLTQAAFGDEAYPSRTVTIIVGLGAGGGADLMARLIAQPLAQKWGRSVVVDNRTGANSTIAFDVVAHAAPDGYTLGLISSIYPIVPSLYKQLHYDPLTSFVPISLLTAQPDVLVVDARLHVQTMKDFIAQAKAKAGAWNYGSAGPAVPGSLEMELLKQQTGINLTAVAFKDGTPAVMPAMLGGEIQATATSASIVAPYVKSGKFVGLAVTGAHRSALLPEVPTFSELGFKGYENGGNWYGIAAPGGTPKNITDKIYNDLMEVMKLPEIQKSIASQGLLTIADTPQQFSALIKEETQKWGVVMKSLGIQPQ